MNSLWDIRIFLGLVPKESPCTTYCSNEIHAWRLPGYSHASQSRDLGSIPDQSMRHISRENWQWATFFSEHFGFPLSSSLHHCSILIFIYMLLIPERKTSESLGSFKQSRDPPYFGSIKQENICLWMFIQIRHYIYIMSHFVGRLGNTWKLPANRIRKWRKM